MAGNTGAKEEGAWKELVKALADQAGGYEEFLKFLKDKEQFLIKGETKKLGELLKKEKEQIDRLDALEDARIAAATGCGGGRDTSLSELLQKAPDEMRNALEETAVRLIEALNRVAIANKTNAELVGTAMEYTDYMLNLLSTAVLPPENTYEATGRIKQSETKVKSFLNKQV